jgi:hypothetical protein
MGFSCHRRLDAAASVVAYDDDMLHLENLDGELKGGGEVGIVRDRQVGNVAVNEHFARVEIDDFGRRHTAVRAPYPKVAWPLLADETTEKTGIDEGLGRSPRTIPSEQGREALGT